MKQYYSHLDSKQTHPDNAIKYLLRKAKKLHRAAQSQSLGHSLPVLRRLITSNTFKNISLVELRRLNKIRRKHILNMLAVEAGFNHWAEYRTALINGEPGKHTMHHVNLLDTGYPNLWFSSVDAAQAYADEHGGEIIVVGKQAMIIAE